VLWGALEEKDEPSSTYLALKLEEVEAGELRAAVLDEVTSVSDEVNAQFQSSVDSSGRLLVKERKKAKLPSTSEELRQRLRLECCTFLMLAARFRTKPWFVDLGVQDFTQHVDYVLGDKVQPLQMSRPDGSSGTQDERDEFEIQQQMKKAVQTTAIRSILFMTMMSGMRAMDANNGGALGPDGNGSDSNVVTSATVFEFVVRLLYTCLLLLYELLTAYPTATAVIAQAVVTVTMAKYVRSSGRDTPIDVDSDGERSVSPVVKKRAKPAATTKRRSKAKAKAKNAKLDGHDEDEGPVTNEPGLSSEDVPPGVRVNVQVGNVADGSGEGQPLRYRGFAPEGEARRSPATPKANVSPCTHGTGGNPGTPTQMMLIASNQMVAMNNEMQMLRNQVASMQGATVTHGVTSTAAAAHGAALPLASAVAPRATPSATEISGAAPNTTAPNPDVWIANEHGKKFHRAGCPKLFGANQVEQRTRQDALYAGYAQCKMCRP
ncbi:unnamed protein product, partial [Symbiodinium necroappetens]